MNPPYIQETKRKPLETDRSKPDKIYLATIDANQITTGTISTKKENYCIICGYTIDLNKIEGEFYCEECYSEKTHGGLP